MKNGWPIKTLSDVADSISTGPFGTMLHKSDYVANGIPLVNPMNIVDSRIVPSQKRMISPETRQRLGNYVLRRGDVIVGRRGELGRCALITEHEDGWLCGTGSCFIRLSKQVDPRFFVMLFSSTHCRDLLNAGSVGATMSNLNQGILNSLPIPIPPLSEQRRIVGILDEAFEGIATAKVHAEKNLQNARELFESHLQFVFTRRGEGWVDRKKPLADLCELIVDCEHRTAPIQEEGIPSIRTPNIGNGRLLLDGVYRVSEETYREWTRRAEPLAGDLILAREAPAGNVAVIPENLRVCLGQRTVLIRPDQSIFDSHFLAFLLLQPHMQQRLLAHSRGVIVQHVNVKDIRALHVGAVPSLSEQKDIVAKIRSASLAGETLISLYDCKLAALEELKKSLLHQAFSGEL